LALGIGANTTMFSVVNSVAAASSARLSEDRLIQISNSDRAGLGFLSPEVYKQLREQSLSFEQVSANQFCRVNFTGLGEPEQLVSPCATANWFELQRASALLGRTFLPDEDQRGRNRVVVLDHAYWLGRFGGDSKIIGTTLTLNNEPWSVIGIMPPTFKPVAAAASPIYTPYVLADNADTGVNVVRDSSPVSCSKPPKRKSR